MGLSWIISSTAHELCLSKAATSRIVIVVLKRRFVLARTNTGDFDEAEIRHVVHGCGQLYRDISDKPSITDFYTDVTQFVLSPTCRSCPSFPTCSACYVPASQSYFSQDEAWLQAKIASFTGRVLDVGMGQVPYLVGAADKIQSGTLSILGLDPDPEAIGLDAGIQVTSGPSRFDAAPASFEHAIAIRSLNHFEDLPKPWKCWPRSLNQAVLGLDRILALAPNSYKNKPIQVMSLPKAFSTFETGIYGFGTAFQIALKVEGIVPLAQIHVTNG